VICTVNRQRLLVNKQQQKPPFPESKPCNKTSPPLIDRKTLFVYRIGVFVGDRRKRGSFADIYSANKMKRFVTTEKAKLYLGISAVFLTLLLIGELSRHPETFGARLVNNVWRLLYVLVANYVLFEYSLPHFGRKKYFKLLFLLFLHVMFYSWGLYAWRLLGTTLHFYTPFRTFASGEEGATDQMEYSMMSVFFFGLARHVYNYTRLKQAARQLRIEKQQAELNYLKSQTNPHFLFNTLNNIYSLSRAKSDLAPESIMRLSKILRYMLYEAGGEYIAIEQELKILGDYIALEQLRYDDSLRVNFNYNVEDTKQAIPPLLLMPLVENAFKHGVSETRSRPFVDIHLSVNQRKLKFVVKNSAENEGQPTRVKENIGLPNLRRQLELLYKEYSLSLQPGESQFTAVLQINLASHV
jgi:two-component system, LytTR family, sensor kinase